MTLQDYYKGIVAARSLLDKREVHLRQMMFGLRLAVTDGPMGMYYEDEWLPGRAIGDGNDI